MDEVLSRNLFREKYLEINKPKYSTDGGIASIQKFQTGGEVFSEKERLGYMLLPVASQLLQGTQRPGQSNLRGLLGDVGKGLEQVPAVALKIAEMSSKKKAVTKSIGAATEAEKTALGVPKDLPYIVSREDGVMTGIVNKPSDKYVADRASRLSSLDQIGRLEVLSEKLGQPTGPVSGRANQVAAYLGLAPAFAELEAETETFRKQAISAIRGAQVGPKEEDSFNAILPKVTDTPSVYQKKLKAAKTYLQNLESRVSKGEGIVSDPGDYDFKNVEKVLGSPISDFKKNVDTYKVSNGKMELVK
jgi:hypothetical protein